MHRARVNLSFLQWIPIIRRPAPCRSPRLRVAAFPFLALALLPVFPAAAQAPLPRPVVPLTVPPRQAAHQRFLARRGFIPGRTVIRAPRMRASLARPQDDSTGAAAWQLFGPTSVTTPSFGAVAGRVTALALDPSDPTGSHLYVGTTGGGVWMAANASAQDSSGIVFTPLTDNQASFNGALEPSLSIGALAVQPGGTGVLLAGTGDPNDVLDSYYGAGILRSTDNGSTWTLIQTTADQQYSFIGEGFAGFAFSTADPQLVVAAVSQAYEGTLVSAPLQGRSYEGLYFSADGGQTWSLARISDPGGDVQGTGDLFDSPDGNAATSVIWNPVRGMFFAAIRFHGYYQSTDGANWTRMAVQPGTGLTTTLCPANPGGIGSTACPIYRGTLAVNPMTGDTFAWTVDIDLQDQGLWQDICAASANSCANPIAFGQQWSTAALQSNTTLGSATILNGDYDLALAALPAGSGQGEDTILLAGDNDLWRCSLAMGCQWRNTTNATSCMSAKVAPYQHALAWNAANPLEIFAGNDSGLWRSTDGIASTDPVCDASDASHFQNLNTGLGSLAEVESLAQPPSTPYTALAGLGANGAAGIKGNSATPAAWPQILTGFGGPVAINPVVPTEWYVNDQAGVAIYECSQSGLCSASDFGSSAIVDNADVGGDGLTMPTPAPFLVDPLDPTQLLVATCRVWRGPSDGSAWSSPNAISPILDNGAYAYCNGDALIRSIAALPLADGSEIIYVGMYGSANGGLTLPGHVLSAIYRPGGPVPVWNDLTFSPVTNDSQAMNAYGLDISSIAIDSHDPTGNTVYVTVAGFASPGQEVDVLYRSTDGGADWTYLTSNLPDAPANSVVVDPQDACTVYVATDVGVYSTRNVTSCAGSASTCWAAFGSGMPLAPVVSLSASPPSATAQLLTAATYGRGLWQIPDWDSGAPLGTASASPSSLTFPSRVSGSGSSTPQSVVVRNTGSVPLAISGLTLTGDSADFSASGCESDTLEPGDSCTIQVTFAPAQAGSRTATLAVNANVSCQQLTVALSGTGLAPPVSADPGAIDFGGTVAGSSSSPLPVTVTNTTAASITFTSAFAVSGPFVLSSNSCTGGGLAADSACVLDLEFTPTQAGAATGSLSFSYLSGGQPGTLIVSLSGTGQVQATDGLSPTSLSFPATIEGQLSAAQTVTLTNNGDVPLTSISAWTSSGYQTSNNCNGGLATHSSCVISVVFAPTVAHSQPGTLSVADEFQTQTVTLSGTGLQPSAIGVLPTSLSFPPQQVGQASQPLSLTVTNTGGSPMANVGFQFMGSSASNFSTGSTTCGATLAAGASCAVQVLFTPAATGGAAATLIVSSSTAGVAAVSVPLSGTGSASGAIGVSPAQIVFPVTAAGQSSDAQSVTITNGAASPLAALTLAVTVPFRLTQNTCGATLAAHASCTTGVVFAPAVNGSYAGTLMVSSTSIAIPAEVPLSGIAGVPGALQAQPGLVNFPLTGLGVPSSPITVTLTNPSGAGSFTHLVLGATGPFQISSTNCPATLPAEGTCTASLVYTPTAAGPQAGEMTVASDQFTAQSFLPLSGTGFDFTVTPGGATTVTVTAGQTASFALTLNLLSQTSPAVLALSCNTASNFPPDASCSFNPSANPQVPATAGGSATLLVSTGQLQGAALHTGPAPWRALPVACGLLLLPFAFGRRRRALLLVVLLGVLSLGVSSCVSSQLSVGSSSPSFGSGITPAGTYSISVNVTANNVTHPISFTLIVD